MEFNNSMKSCYLIQNWVTFSEVFAETDYFTSKRRVALRRFFSSDFSSVRIVPIQFKKRKMQNRKSAVFGF